MTNKLEYKSFEIKAIAHNEPTNELTIDAYASIFDVEDTLNPSWHPELKTYVLAKDIVKKGAFTKTISERGNRIKFLRNHNMENPVGKPIEIKEDEMGLFTTSRISDAEPELKTKIREGIFNEMSIGYAVVKCEFKQVEDGTYIRTIYEAKLIEYSIVTLARNENARVTELKTEYTAEELLNALIENEKNEEKKFQLLQLQSLIDFKPIDSLEKNEPIVPEVKKVSLLTNLKFIN